MEKFFDVEEELRSFKVPFPKDFNTRAIHVAQEPDQWSSRAMVPPIHLSSIYQLEDQENFKYIYLRVGSPSRDVLQKCFANLNDAKHAIMFSTGQGATSSIMMSLEAGAHVIICKYIYGETSGLYFYTVRNHSYFRRLVRHRSVENAITPCTKMVFFETPSNPVLRCFDIQAISDAVHSVRKDIIVAIDNTFMTPYLQRPLNFGVDIVMHSCGKYINGHSDVVMGTLVMNDDNLYNRLRQSQIRMGNVPSPFDCYLVLRGLKTLSFRMNQISRSALVVAKFLQSHPAVERVAHPGLLTDESHEIAIKQSSGHCGMIAFWLIDGITMDQNKKALKMCKIVTVSGSLGGPESTIVIPFLIIAQTHPKEIKEETGFTSNLVRLSIGLEEPEVLIEDLKQALDSLL